MTIRIKDQYVVPAGTTLDVSGASAFRIEQPAGAPATALTIAGAVNAFPGTGGGGVGYVIGVLAPGGDHANSVAGILIETTGALKVVSTSKFTGWGIQNTTDHASLAVTNHGRLEVASTPSAAGVAGGFTRSTLINTGIIDVTSTTGEAGAVAFSGGGRFENTGQIRAAGAEESSGGFFSVGWKGGETSFFNGGSIRVSDQTAALDSYAVAWNSPIAAAGWVNAGLLEGDYALRVFTAGGSALATFINSGEMIGRVDMGDDATRLVNTGHIRGDVVLLEGADIYDGAAGTLAGMLSGGGGADTLAGGANADSVSGDQGDDRIDGGAGADTLAGGDGLDTVSVANAALGMEVDLTQGRAFDGTAADLLSGFENVLGGVHGDTITGSASANLLEGDLGADRVFGRAGNDTLSGGDGEDYLRGEEGADSLSGGAAFDDVHGNMGDDTVVGGDGDDWVVGGKDNDVLRGDAGGDIVYGNIGADTLDGGEGADIIRGGQSDDTLNGGEGDDWLAGDRGTDIITGGAGADIFHTFTEADVDWVTDFNAAEGDRVNLLTGTDYLLRQEGAHAVLTLVSGGRLVLANVQSAALPEGWIFYSG